MEPRWKNQQSDNWNVKSFCHLHFSEKAKVGRMRGWGGEKGANRVSPPSQFLLAVILGNMNGASRRPSFHTPCPPTILRALGMVGRWETGGLVEAREARTGAAQDC